MAIMNPFASAGPLPFKIATGASPFDTGGPVSVYAGSSGVASVATGITGITAVAPLYAILTANTQLADFVPANFVAAGIYVVHVVIGDSEQHWLLREKTGGDTDAADALITSSVDATYCWARIS